jgi:chromosome segregation ATPase
MADLTSVVIAGALRGDGGAAIAENVLEENEEPQRRFNLCDWKNLTCCETFDRVNLIITSLFIIAVIGGGIAIGAGVTPVSSVVIIYAIWAAYVGALAITYTVKYMELGSMAHQTNRLRREVDDVQEEVGKLENTNRELTGQVSQLQGINTELNGEVQRLESVNRELSDQVEKIKALHRELTGEMKRLETVHAELKEQVERFKLINSELTHQVSGFEEENRKLEKSNKVLEGNINLLGKGVTDFDAIRKEQEKVSAKWVEMLVREESFLKRFEEESKKQEELTKNLAEITQRFDKAKPVALKLIARVFFYARRYNELKGEVHSMMEAASKEINTSPFNLESIKRMVEKMEKISEDHFSTTSTTFRGRINREALLMAAIP